jgi:endoglucanase Acf2
LGFAASRVIVVPLGLGSPFETASYTKYLMISIRHNWELNNIEKASIVQII